MSKAIRVDHLATIPLDRADAFLRVERRYWADGTSCLHIAKWGIKDGKATPWWPVQYTQIRWEQASEVIRIIADALAGAMKGTDVTR